MIRTSKKSILTHQEITISQPRMRNYTESCSWDAEADCQKNVVWQEKINIPHHFDSHGRYLCSRIISTSGD